MGTSFFCVIPKTGESSLIFFSLQSGYQYILLAPSSFINQESKSNQVPYFLLFLGHLFWESWPDHPVFYPFVFTLLDKFFCPWDFLPFHVLHIFFCLPLDKWWQGLGMFCSLLYPHQLVHSLAQNCSWEDPCKRRHLALWLKQKMYVNHLAEYLCLSCILNPRELFFDAVQWQHKWTSNSRTLLHEHVPKDMLWNPFLEGKKYQAHCQKQCTNCAYKAMMRTLGCDFLVASHQNHLGCVLKYRFPGPRFIVWDWLYSHVLDIAFGISTSMEASRVIKCPCTDWPKWPGADPRKTTPSWPQSSKIHRLNIPVLE